METKKDLEKDPKIKIVDMNFPEFLMLAGSLYAFFSFIFLQKNFEAALWSGCCVFLVLVTSVQRIIRDEYVKLLDIVIKKLNEVEKRKE